MKSCAVCGGCFDDGYDLCAFDGAELTTLFAGGRVIGGRYLLEQRLAQGAMGVVFRAAHLQVGSSVAVKLMQPRADDVRVALQRFHREAQILGQVKHPNAVLVIDFGVEERGSEVVPYLVMELLRGASLHDVLHEKGRYRLDELAAVIDPLCDVVEEAHAVGVIHRDIKPSNVFLERLRDGSSIVKVLDFGIGKFIVSAQSGLRPPRGNIERGAKPTIHVAAPGADLPAPVDGLWSPPFTDVTETFADFDSQLDSELDAELDDPVTLATIEDALGDRSDQSEDEAFVSEVMAVRADRAVRALRDDATVRARRRGAEALAAPPTTNAGLMIGTIPYMAHEQMTGERVSRRTDVHAVAVLTFQLLAGRLPFDGDDDDIIHAKLSDERPSLRELGIDVPAHLDELLQRAFARDPSERPASVRAIADAVRRAATGPAAEADPVTATAVQLGAISRSLAQVEGALSRWAAKRRDGDAYEKTRDLLLAADAPVLRLVALLEQIRPPLNKEQRTLLLESRGDLEVVVSSLHRALGLLALRDDDAADYAEYLTALWMRLDGQLQDVALRLASLSGGSGASTAASPVAWLQKPPAPTADLPELVARLLSKDLLDAADALDELLDDHIEAVVAQVAKRDDAATALVRGLWRHADALLLAERYAPRRFRLFAFVAQQTDLAAAAPFAWVARAFQGEPFDVDDALSALLTGDGDDDPEDPTGPLLRCLLLHPDRTLGARALQGLSLSELWNVIAHPATPPSILRALFEHAAPRAPAEYLKVFFFCAQEALLSAHGPVDLEEALLLLRAFFAVPSFHEDVVFEPLLRLERSLRLRAQGVAALSQSAAFAAYQEDLATFTAGTLLEEAPLSNMRDVPLPIQRKLAREGHFIATFVSHSNDRVARETVPHLLRLEDVTRFLRIATIHRVVLVELAKRRRFFKKDAAKVALLANPKTPAVVARLFLPLVSDDQLRLLSSNKHINPDVRRLIVVALHRPPA